MKQRSPTLQGFQMIFAMPLLGLSEIAWRWSFGFAAVALVMISGLEYLDTLVVTPAELFLLRTRHPVLVSRAIARIFEGSAPRALGLGIGLMIFLAIGWTILAALGRAAMLKALFERFQKNPHSSSTRLWPLMGLNFLRVIVTILAAAAYVGALLLGGAASSPKDPSPGTAALIFFTLVIVITLIWTVLNWFLSLASIFAFEQHHRTLRCLVEAVEFLRTRSGSVWAAGTWFGLAHLVTLFAVTSVIAFPLAFAELLPAGVVVGGVLLVGLLYFAVVDFLYVGRLAAYVYILAGPDAEPSLSRARPSGPAPPIHARVDPGELILSDLPASSTA
jgi:hypothetical protein